MIEVLIDSIRVSLMTQHRLVVLREQYQDRYLAIWIGTFEAEAITAELQKKPRQRPFTHDLLKSLIEQMGGKVAHILVNDMRQDIYYARIVIETESGEQVELDSRPSDAIALAVRVGAPIFVSEYVMEKSGFAPEEDLTEEVELDLDSPFDLTFQGGEEEEEIDETRLSAFADFVNTLDLDDLEDNED